MGKNIKKTGLFVLFFLALVTSPAYAQTRPASSQAGAVQQGLEERPFVSKPLKAEDMPFRVEKPEREIEIPEGIKIVIKKINLTGNTVIPTAELTPIISKYEGKELTFKDLTEMSRELESTYHTRGYFLAQAYLPEQEIKEGVIKVVILEGKLGKVLIKGAKFYNQEFIRKHFHPAKKGIIFYSEFIKSLLLINENSDCDVRATLMRGKEPGTTDIMLTIKDKLPLHTYFDFNNFGSRYISKNRYDLSGMYTNLFMAGDTLYLRGVLGQPPNRMKFARGEYGWFLNSYGTKVKFSYDWLEYDCIKDLKQIDASGKSEIYGVDVTHPFIRNRNTSLDAGMGFDYKSVYDYQLSETITDDEVRLLKLKVKYDHLDSLQGRNYFLGMIGWGLDIWGARSENASPTAFPNQFLSRPGSGGEFTKLNMSFVRVQKLPWSSFVILKLSGQYASDDVPVPEQFTIGGADSVRGYAPAEYLGDMGYDASFEWRFPPPFIGERRFPFLNRRVKETVQLVTFVDHGSVYYHNYDPATEKRQKHITGAGVGIRFNLPHDTSVRVDCGFPLHTDDNKHASEVYFEFNMKLF